MRKNEKITALYERLSRDDFGKDDDQQRESNSISNQKAMLEEFAARQGFTNIVHFTDDGISGTCFDRPGFLAMMKEVEAGNVEYLCIKDMSRMGRDYTLFILPALHLGYQNRRFGFGCCCGLLPFGAQQGLPRLP